MMEKDRKARGNVGENIAAEFLKNKGYSVTKGNFRAGHLETDIVCETGTHILFGEVKVA